MESVKEGFFPGGQGGQRGLSPHSAGAEVVVGEQVQQPMAEPALDASRVMGTDIPYAQLVHISQPSRSAGSAPHCANRTWNLMPELEQVP